MDGGDVLGYLDANKIEAEITAAVAECVEQGAAQPLAFLAELFSRRAKEAAVDFDYEALVLDLTELVRSNKCGPELVRLSWHDAGTFSAALGGGGPNAAMRFPEGGEAAFEANEGLDATIALLAPLKLKYRNISHADLWALAANVAIQEMGGPAIATRFGRLDANSLADSVESQAGRLPTAGTEGSAVLLRDAFYAKGFNDREIVALSAYALVDDYGFDQARAAAAAAPCPVARRGDASARLPCSLLRVLRQDAGFQPWVEAFAADQPKLLADFAAAWWKLQELGCEGLVPHPQALAHASSCWLPTTWVELPLLASTPICRSSPGIRTSARRRLLTRSVPSGQGASTTTTRRSTPSACPRVPRSTCPRQRACSCAYPAAAAPRAAAGTTSMGATRCGTTRRCALATRRQAASSFWSRSRLRVGPTD